MGRVRGVVVLCGAATALAVSPAGSAAADFERALSTPGATSVACTDRLLPARPGVVNRDLAAPSLGVVEARLTGAGGDWDLAVIDADTGRVVAGSAFGGTREVASGFVYEDEPLVIQACRRHGASNPASLSVDFAELEVPESPETFSLARVYTPDDASVARLQALGLDLTEHGGPGFVEVVLHGTDDGATLRQAGFRYDLEVADLAAQSEHQRRADRRFARGADGSTLPSGQDTYRRLFDYSEELKALAAANPKLVRHFTLPYSTYEGRPVEGIEITKGVKRRDGKPVFLNMGLHHAREWPSGEHALEWAYELIDGFKQKRKPFRKLVKRTRTIIVPVVNPDGFNTSREAGQLQGAGDGRGGDIPDPATAETLNIVSHPLEYRRKNCRLVDDSEAGNCAQPSVGLAEPGVDPNRNYGGFWGGPGASAPGEAPPGGNLAQDYRGPGPFSEPETQNIRWLVSRHQVTTLITNHTFSNLVLRPPGLSSQGAPFDEKVLKRLGDAMAAENGYTSQRGYELYDTSGTTEDWSYNATGGLGYTFEIGPDHFHPPFADTVAEYEGTTDAAGDGGGNRAAFLLAQRSTKKPKRHSLIAGKAPKRAILTLKKKFKTPTSPVLDANGEAGEAMLLDDKLKTVMRVRRSGRFRWHVNPSTRPLVAKGVKKPQPIPGEPSDPVSFSGAPGPSAVPCADADTEDEGCFNDHPFEVPGGAGIDNGTASVRIQWATVASDWDMKIFRDGDGNGTSVGEGTPVGASASGPTDSEATTISVTPGDYVVRATNFAATEPYEGTVTFGKSPPEQKRKVERWRLTCKRKLKGKVLARRKIKIKRGKVRRLDLRQACRR